MSNSGTEPARAPKMVDASTETVRQAADVLVAGGLVAFPTETVYGLGADATNDVAVAKIFAAKKRPTFNPLIVHVLDAGQAALYALFDARAQKLAERFWPGPLTLVLKRRDDCTLSELVSAGLDTVALRVPAHPVARAVLAAARLPLAAPSANPSGTVSPTAALHVALGPTGGLHDEVDLIVDGGGCVVGIESTIVDLSGDVARVLRPGGIANEAIEAEIGPLGETEATQTIKAPGMMQSHYAPSIPLRMNVAPEDRLKGEAYLTFGPTAPKRAALNLSLDGDLVEATANLFAMIRALDQPGIRGIAVQPIPDEGLGHAINDRLTRASAPREDTAGASCPGAVELPEPPS